ncbi:MAG: hypothetical protein M1324_01135 [Patescibacteria group bacterium]|nr:hypothetical protein [Patescibacteria group bacterium]
MKNFKKFFIIFLSVVFITQFFIVDLFLFPQKAHAASPQIVNKQVQTLASGENLLHSSLVVNNMLFAGTRTSPAKIMKWSNLSDLTSYSVNTFANDNKHNKAESMTYDSLHNKVYIAFSWEYTAKVAVTQFDPDTFTFTDVIYDATENPGGSPAITNDGTYLYIVTYNSPAKILKYQISDFTKVGSVSITGRNTGHSIIYDGVNLYATGVTSPGWVAKISPNDLSYSTATFQVSDDYPTDDLTNVGDYIYAGLEATTGIIVRVKKSDLSLTRIATGQTTSNYGVYYDSQYVWGAYNSAPGNLIRIDPDTLFVNTFTFGTGENYLNEVLSDGQKLIATCWLSPAKILRFNIDTTPPVLSVNSPANGISTILSTIAISGTSTDVVAGIASVTVNGAAVSSPTSFSQNVDLSFGLNTVVVIATDNAGNTTTTNLDITRNSYSSGSLSTKRAIIKINNSKLNQKLQRINQKRKIKLEILRNKIKDKLAKIKNKVLF